MDAVHVAGLDAVQGGVVGGHLRAAVQSDADGVALFFEGGRMEGHGGRAHKARHEEVGGVVVEVLRGVDLLDEAPLHDHDATTHGHGLHLVVGDVDEGGAQPFVEAGDLGPHDPAELGVQIGQRLVQKEDLGASHDGAAQSHSLPLAARQSLGLALQIFRDAQDAGGLGDLLTDDLLGDLGGLEGKGHVLVDRHVRVEGVVLEDHGDVAVARLHVVDDIPVDAQLPRRDVLQPRDHAEGGGFPTARGADKDDEFLVADLHVEVVDRFCGTVVDLVDVLEGERGHRMLL